MLITTIVFGFAAATALIRSTFAADMAVTAEIVWPSYGVPAGEAAVLLVPLPVFTNTSALLLPTSAVSGLPPAALSHGAPEETDTPYGRGTPLESILRF